MKRRWAIVVALLIVVVGSSVLLPRRIRERHAVVPGRSPGVAPSAPSQSPALSERVGAAGASPAASRASTTRSAKAATDPNEIANLDLSSAQATVATQLDLLRRGRDAAFAATFLPSVIVSPEAIAACKKRVQSVAVRPDWEMALDSLEQGHAVRRVSMFGKSMTGFHQTDRRWLADALWCVPTGLP